MKISKFKKIILILLCALLVFGIAKRKKVKSYFIDERYYNTLTSLHLLKKCYNPSEDFIEIFAQEGIDYKKVSEQAINNSLAKILDQNFDKKAAPKIPTITHKLYFTPSKAHVVLNDFYIEEMRINYTKLNALGYNWQHNIWVNQADLIPNELRNIKGVKVRAIDEFKNHPSYNTLVDLIDKGNDLKPYLAQAADLMRLMAVQKYGGVYSDVDYEIYNPEALFELMQKFDFIAAKETWAANGYYGNAFIAAKPNHPILNEALKSSLRNYNLDIKDPNIPDYLKYPCSNYNTLYFNGPPLITIAYFNKNNIDGNSDAILPPWMIYNVNFARYKNQTCDIDKITKEFMDDKDKNLDQLLADFIANPVIVAGQKQDLVVGNALRPNIYYNIKDRAQFKIIGADMFCGSWTEGGKAFKKRYYWNLP